MGVNFPHGDGAQRPDDGTRRPLPALLLLLQRKEAAGAAGSVILTALEAARKPPLRFVLASLSI